MQFGRLQGTALAFLGIFLILAQGLITFGSKQPDVQNESSSRPSKHKSTIIPGVLGIGLVAAGIGIVFSARRRDEPHPENAVK